MILIPEQSFQLYLYKTGLGCQNAELNGAGDTKHSVEILEQENIEQNVCFGQQEPQSSLSWCFTGGHGFNITLAINSHRPCQVVHTTGHITFVLKGP